MTIVPGVAVVPDLAVFPGVTFSWRRWFPGVAVLCWHVLFPGVALFLAWPFFPGVAVIVSQEKLIKLDLGHSDYLRQGNPGDSLCLMLRQGNPGVWALHGLYWPLGGTLPRALLCLSPRGGMQQRQALGAVGDYMSPSHQTIRQKRLRQGNPGVHTQKKKDSVREIRESGFLRCLRQGNPGVHIFSHQSNKQGGIPSNT